MIEAQDLRKGNLVQRPESIRIDILDAGRIYWLVDHVMIRDCEHYKDNWAFEAIPITEEIMDTLGERTALVNTTEVHWKIGGFLYALSYPQLQKGLHWFQNYHYFRTGEELTINL